MSDYRDAFEEQLVLASERLSKTTSRRSWAARHRRGLLASLVVTASAGTALAATTPWSPQLGDPDLPARDAAVATRDAPPAGQLAALGVLRREPTATDRSAETERQLEYLSRLTRGVRVDAIRRVATTATGAAIVVVPAQGWKPYASAREVLNPVCLILPDQTDGAAKSCWSTETIGEGKGIAELGQQLYGLVPDDVREVRATFDSGTSVTVPVADNFFQLTEPANPLDPEPTGQRARRLSGLDADGNVTLELGG